MNVETTAFHFSRSTLPYVICFLRHLYHGFRMNRVITELSGCLLNKGYLQNVNYVEIDFVRSLVFFH